MASNLFVCYSPKGEKFELTRPNYLDATQNFGFTTNPPGSAPAPVADEGEEDEPEVPADAEQDAPADEPADEDETSEADEQAEEEAPVEDEAPASDEAPAFDPADRDSVKAFLRKKEVQFDGRASLDDLVKLATGVPAE